MISVSRIDSCLRMPNISSCLRLVLAILTSSSSAKETRSAGVLALRSWSFISRIRGRPMEMTGGEDSKGNGWSARGEGGIADLGPGFLGHLTRCNGRSHYADRQSAASACVLEEID